jgi:shikimate dehydrogenase
MRTFGLIGFPLSHSFSKKYFTEKFEKEQITGQRYELFPLKEIDQLLPLLANTENLKGLNVTIPYKLSIIPFLDEVEDAALKIGAVNCISIESKNGQQWLKGYNTDAYGFAASLSPLLKPNHTKALIFGDGGAAKAVKYVLNQLQISFLIVVRKPSPGCILYNELTPEQFKSHQLLINTTPLGMSPETNSCPDIPYQFLTADYLVYDLIYNPEETLFLEKSRKHGAKIKNGLEMLYLQAERSWEIWNT